MNQPEIVIVNWETISLIFGDSTNRIDDETKSLYLSFISYCGSHLRNLAELDPSSADKMKIARKAHMLYGNATSFGFDRVAALLQTIENEFVKLTPERINEMLREALTAFEQAVREVKERYPEFK